MYRVENRVGQSSVVVLDCDLCGQPITEADPGTAVVPRVLRAGKTYPIRHAHAGRCQQVLEEELAQQDARERDPTR
jgi:hypothetical protein